MYPNPSIETMPKEFWYRQKVVERVLKHNRRYKDRLNEFITMSEYDLDDYELIRAARLYFGSWDNALTAAGLNGMPGKNGKRGRGTGAQPQLTKSRLLEIISGLAASGEDMSPENMVVMHNVIWQSACGKNGYYSHWPTVLRNAGADLHTVNTGPYWSEERVKNSILDIYESQLLLTTPFIRENYWHLYRFGMKYFGSWKGAVSATGLGYENVVAEYAENASRQQRFQNSLYPLLERTGRHLGQPDANTAKVEAARGAPGIFSIDGSTGTMIGTIARSWQPGLETGIARLQNAFPNSYLELYFLMGEPRTWCNSRVTFINACDLTERSMEVGADRWMKNILALQYNVPSFL